MVVKPSTDSNVQGSDNGGNTSNNTCQNNNSESENNDLSEHVCECDKSYAEEVRDVFSWIWLIILLLITNFGTYVFTKNKKDEEESKDSVE